MSEEQFAMLMQIQAIGLTLGDLALYMDTHPFDRLAMSHFNMTVADYDNKMAQYEEKYGPLQQAGMIPENSEGFPWALTDFPWDW